MSETAGSGAAGFEAVLGGARWALIEGDSAEVLRALPDNSIDALVTDPPAGISFMGRAWDGDKGGWRQWIEWLAGIMREALRVLKPGGHALVWALPRTSHWTATALEEAGWEIRGRVEHLHCTGFPKSVDRRQVPPERAGWGSALKPAHEDWWLCRKPLAGTIAETVRAWGTGLINVAGCRVGISKRVPGGLSRTSGVSLSGSADGSLRRETGEEGGHDPNLGRWPPDFVMSHAEPCEEGGPCVPGCVVATLNAQAPHSVSKRAPRGKGLGYHGAEGEDTVGRGHNDAGPLSRFFPVFHPEKTSLCSLCELPIEAPELTLNSAIQEVQCGLANGANETSSQLSLPDDFAPTNAPGMNGRDAVDRAGESPSPVSNVGNYSKNTPAITESIAPANAPLNLNELNALNVLSAASLCVQCATAIAQSVVAISHGQDPAHSLGLVSMSGPRRQTLLRSLAAFAAGLESTDTTTTTTALRRLLGSALPVTENTTAVHAVESGLAQSPSLAIFPVLYSSKPSRREKELGCEYLPAKSGAEAVGREEGSKGTQSPRAGGGRTANEVRNFHPTPKGVRGLMSWLCRLVTPPGGVVLDPFAGSGSTGCAALLEGFRFIGIEKEPEYAAIARARITYWEAEAKRESAKPAQLDLLGGAK